MYSTPVQVLGKIELQLVDEQRTGIYKSDLPMVFEKTDTLMVIHEDTDFAGGLTVGSITCSTHLARWWEHLLYLLRGRVVAVTA